MQSMPSEQPLWSPKGSPYQRRFEALRPAEIGAEDKGPVGTILSGTGGKALEAAVTEAAAAIEAKEERVVTPIQFSDPRGRLDEIRALEKTARETLRGIEKGQIKTMIVYQKDDAKRKLATCVKMREALFAQHPELRMWDSTKDWTESSKPSIKVQNPTPQKTPGFFQGSFQEKLETAKKFASSAVQSVKGFFGRLF